MVQINTGEVSAHITVNRNRLKTYDNNVYLKNESNFEIEIWNPKTTRVLAVVSINGNLISQSGIIVNPGQRIYLERWIDEAKKFLFSTYNVENSSTAKNAIRDNGKVEIKFYNETTVFYDNGLKWTYNSSSLPFGGTTLNTQTFAAGSNASVNYTDTSVSSINISSIETGRTEKGENSSQELHHAFGNFDSWSFKTIEWQILPESSRPVEADKIRSYCTECGTRVRASSWKFCPSCGTKF
jgi:hypothetical protein